MAHELNHAEAAELLGVYALDALDADERVAVEHHLVGCGMCRAEVMEHVEVAGLLTSGIAGPPSSVWDRIAEDITETPPPLDLATIHRFKPAPVIQLPPSSSAGPSSPGTSSSGPSSAGGRTSGRGNGVRVIGLIAAASIAASVIGVLGLKVVEDNRVIDSITAGGHPAALERTIDAAKANPDAVKVDLRSPDGGVFAEAWLLPDGRGYLARNNLPTLDLDHSYQLWAVVGGDKISVGVLGSAPEATAFVASGPVSALAITDEVAGGVVASLQQPVVVGAVRPR